MADYSLVTLWRLPAPIERVWECLIHSERWPLWWKFVEKVEAIAPGDAEGIGSVRRYTWRTRLPYKLTFELQSTHVEKYSELEAIASGDLEGYGKCRLVEEKPYTLVRFEWNVRPGSAWIQWLSPLARPLFIWNHQKVMQAGEKALVHLLESSGS